MQLDYLFVKRTLLFLIGISFLSFCKLLGSPLKSGFEQRRDSVLNWCATGFVPPPTNIPDPEKYYFPIILSRLKMFGPKDSIANHYITLFANENPFHFTMVGRAMLLSKFHDADALKKYKIRYISKFFNRQDSYNAFTGEGTENHLNMSRTSGYLIAELGFKMMGDPYMRSQKDSAKLWLRLFHDKLLGVGNGEWNSSTYTVFNSMGWLSLYDHAQDEEVKQWAKDVLDFYAKQIATFYFHGVIAGPEMRGGRDYKGLNSGNAWLGWLWFGGVNSRFFDKGFLKSHRDYIYSSYAALSTYRPPKEAFSIQNRFGYSHGTFPNYDLTKPNYISYSLLNTPTYHLSSAQIPYASYTYATGQIVSWKLCILIKPDSFPAIILGNGRFYSNQFGTKLCPYLSIIQDSNVINLTSHVPNDWRETLNCQRASVDQWKNQWKSDFVHRFPNDTTKKCPVTEVDGLYGLNKVYISVPTSLSGLQKDGLGLITLLGVDTVRISSQGNWSRDTIYYEPTSQRTIIETQAGLGKSCGFLVSINRQTRFKPSQQVNPIPEVPIMDWGVGPIKPCVWHDQTKFKTVYTVCE